MKRILTAVSAAFICATSYGLAMSFSMDDIHFWVGEGTNRCGVVIDWYGEAKAWGYRWNGTCTNLLTVVERIVREDHRLAMGCQKMTSTYVDLYFFGYDVNDGACQWDMKNGGASDPSALVGIEDSIYYSQWWVLYGPMNGQSFPTETQLSSGYAANRQIPVADDWFVFTIGSPEYDSSWNESPATLAVPSAAESPYAYSVVDYSVASETDTKYRDPENVIGRPTSYMSGAWGGPVSPYNPAWMDGELFSLDDEDSFVTIEFDHDVIDDPNNPFGIDFIVFGNAFGVGTTDEYYDASIDPANCKFKGTSASEQAVVEVSQDGTTWYTYTSGPYADDWAPTLGLKYDVANPDTSLYAGNRWWGEATDACYPVDPTVSWGDITGLKLSELCKRYNGSAGGTGFDLSRLNLPLNAAGRKWIRYVRIKPYYDEEEDEWTAPDIDAVSDVAPVSGFRQWQLANYDWTTVWNESISGSDAIAANGKKNGMNYILGYSANETYSLDFRISKFTPGELYHDLEILSNSALPANCGIKILSSSDLNVWAEELPTYLPTSVNGEGLTVNTLRVSNSGKFFKVVLGE